jgi:hypothetical protein
MEDKVSEKIIENNESNVNSLILELYLQNYDATLIKSHIISL